MPRCAIYARFSTDRQSATSAEDQVASCSTRATAAGWEVAGVYTDLAISGASNRRPGMTAMLADAAAGAFDIVLAEALDRIARNQADIASIYQKLDFADVAIETLSEGKISELHIGLKGTMGALFLKDLADKIRRGQRGTVSRGRVPGGLTYGYEVVNRLRGDGTLERGLRRVREDQAAVVWRIYAEVLAGRSAKMIAHELNAEGIPSPRGGEWRGSTISGSRARGIGILRNPVYAGRYLYGRVTMRLDPESRRRISRPNAADDRVLVDMPDLRIVSDADWQAVQDLLDARGVQPLRDRTRPRHLLSGLITCGTCAGAMVVIHHGRYGCTRHREAGTCTNSRSIKRVELERRVLAGVVDQLLAPEAVSRIVATYHREIALRQRDRERGAVEIDARIAKADKSITRLVEAIADGGADFGEIRESLIARKTEREDLRRQKAEVGAVPVIALNPGIIESYRARVRSLASHLDGTTAEGREVLERLRDLIERVRCTPTNAGWDVELTSSLGSAVALATTDLGREPINS